MSEYIPRGYSRIPLLTLYALGNFIIVLISCVCTVFVLRLYYRPPSFLSAKRNQVPYSVRFIVFRILAPMCLFKVHCRKNNEDFEGTGHFNTKINESKKESSNSKKIGNKCDLVLTLDQIIVSQQTPNQISTDEEYEKYGQKLLVGLKSLNRNLHENDSSSKESNSSFLRNEVLKQIYLEEWKHIALVLDR